MSISKLWEECRNHRNIFYQDSPLSQSSETSALSNLMSERFIQTSPPMRMEGVENIEIQQTRSHLRYVKCSEDLSSCLPPLGFFEPFFILHQYLTCKHIVHYDCIDNPRKLCPLCSWKLTILKLQQNRVQVQRRKNVLTNQAIQPNKKAKGMLEKLIEE